ncbi:MAG: hypothetical protein N2690_04230 [Rhodocyclaceae bacterium]|nr:hypothetical protein [Rhodocyclaceae bacterium]
MDWSVGSFPDMRATRLVSGALLAAALMLSSTWVRAEEGDDAADAALRKLEALMQQPGPGVPGLSSMRLVRKQPSPIKGLDALVYDAMVEENGQVTPKRIVVFADPARKYLVMGTIIDIDKKQDLANVVLSSVKDPKVAVAALQRVPLLPRQAPRTVTVVADLGLSSSRSFLEEVIRRRASYKVNVDLALVSNAEDQKAVGAQAIIAGSAGEEFFYDALAQWLRKGKNAEFLNPEKLRQDKNIQVRLARGIFHIERNTTELLEAGVNVLPLLFVSDRQGVKQVSLPRTEDQWRKIFGVE